jgi:hypothetical protein
VELEDALAAYASDAWSSLVAGASSRVVDKKGSKKRMATSSDLANSSRPAKRGTPGKRKKLVARLLNEADSKITLKQRSEKEREREGVDDSQNDRGERRGGVKKQEKEKERTEGMKEARPLGRDVRKRFLGYGVFSGKVVSYNPDSGLYGIEYEDGEYEELDELKVRMKAHDEAESIAVVNAEEIQSPIPRKSKEALRADTRISARW